MDSGMPDNCSNNNNSSLDLKMNPWRTLDNRKIYSNNWITVEEDQVITPSGQPGIYGKVCPKGKAIGVVALDNSANIYLVGQFRYMLNEYSWEIPEGASNPGEEPLETARRELKEETGLTAQSWEFLIRLHTSNSFTDEEAFIFIARDLEQFDPEPDDDECIEIKKIPFKSALDMVLKGEITDAMSVAAILKIAYLGLDSKRVDVLYEDEYCIAVNKPSALLVHRTNMSRDKDFLLQRVRDQIKMKIDPIHRLDRPTSGIVLFSKKTETLPVFFKLFEKRQIQKTYIAVVRGFTDDKGLIDYPLKNKNKNNVAQSAITEYETLARVEMNIPVEPYDSSRYSLVKINLYTGRTHQIRRHFKHLFHPLIGDSTYGDMKHNKMFKEKLHCSRLLLHACRLEFKHPITNENICITSDLDDEFNMILQKLGFELNDKFKKCF
jgi:tRNA pseudouridine65 synthase